MRILGSRPETEPTGIDEDAFFCLEAGRALGNPNAFFPLSSPSLPSDIVARVWRLLCTRRRFDVVRAAGDWCSDTGRTLLPFRRMLELAEDNGRADSDEEAVDIVRSLAGAGNMDPVVCHPKVNNMKDQQAK